MNKVLKAAIRRMSHHQGDMTQDYEKSRKKEKMYPYYKGRSCNTMDRVLHVEDHEILLRTFSFDGKIAPVILFFHGGGFVTGDFDSYGNVCANLSERTGYKVVSVNYRLAPEHKFPQGLMDCYAAMQAVLEHCEDWYQVKPEDVVIMGDSAGGTICSVLGMMARDKKERMPRRQVLIYPAAYGSYGEENPYPSMEVNGSDYLLTRALMCEYMELYRNSEEDLNNPYFAPLRNKDFSNLPETLVITMEYDPLRDEGEALGVKMKEAGCQVTFCRVDDGIHGMVLLPPVFPGAKEIYQAIESFLCPVAEEFYLTHYAQREASETSRLPGTESGSVKNNKSEPDDQKENRKESGKQRRKEEKRQEKEGKRREKEKRKKEKSENENIEREPAKGSGWQAPELSKEKENDGNNKSEAMEP